jgi:hypothetical protein
MRNPQSEILNPRSQRPLPKQVCTPPRVVYGVRGPEAMHSPKSETRNPKSEMGNPQFVIRNPQSEIATIARQPPFISGQSPFISGQTALISGQPAPIAGQNAVILGFIIGEFAGQTPSLSPNMDVIFVIYTPISRRFATFSRTYRNGREKNSLMAIPTACRVHCIRRLLTPCARNAGRIGRRKAATVSSPTPRARNSRRNWPST